MLNKIIYCLTFISYIVLSGLNSYALDNYNTILKMAQQGDAAAQYKIAKMYDNGSGVAKNKCKAFEWYKKAAESGNADAQNCLGVMYEFGECVKKDIDQALIWYNSAKENGNLKAKANYLEIKADRGDTLAQYQLADLYMSGKIVKQNCDKAFKLYSRAEINGNIDAKIKIGEMFEYGICKRKDETKAFQWYTQAFERDNKKALEYIQRIINKVNPYYIYNFGKTFDTDYTGNNDEEAIKWYIIAAEKGYMTAQCELAKKYEQGKVLQKDLKKALYWYEKAANNNCIEAQIILVEKYEKGDGVEKDISKALYWCERAKLLHSTKAEQIYPRLSNERNMIYFLWFIALTPCICFLYFYYTKTNLYKKRQKIIEQRVLEEERRQEEMRKREEELRKKQEEERRKEQERQRIAIEEKKRKEELAKEEKKRKEELARQMLVERATVQKDGVAQFELALKYFQGDEFPQDYKMARILLQSAAEQDIVEAQLVLGKMYEEGFAARQSIELALEMYGKACDNGNLQGCENYKRLLNLRNQPIQVNMNILKDGFLDKIKDLIQTVRSK